MPIKSISMIDEELGVSGAPEPSAAALCCKALMRATNRFDSSSASTMQPSSDTAMPAPYTPMRPQAPACSSSLGRPTTTAQP